MTEANGRGIFFRATP